MNEVIRKTNEQLGLIIKKIQDEGFSIVAYSVDQDIEQYSFHDRYGGEGMWGPFPPIKQYIPGFTASNKATLYIAPNNSLFDFDSLRSKSRRIADGLALEGEVDFGNISLVETKYKKRRFSFFNLGELYFKSSFSKHYVQGKFLTHNVNRLRLVDKQPSLEELTFPVMFKSNLDKRISEIKSLRVITKAEDGDHETNPQLLKKARELVRETRYALTEESKLDLLIKFFPHKFFAEYAIKFHSEQPNIIYKQLLDNFDEIKSFKDYAIKNMILSGQYTKKVIISEKAYKKCEVLFNRKEFDPNENKYDRIPYMK